MCLKPLREKVIIIIICEHGAMNVHALHIFFIAVQDCKKKWKYLRDTFMKTARQKKGKSGKAGRKKKPREFYEQLTFLQSHVAVNNNK